MLGTSLSTCSICFSQQWRKCGLCSTDRHGIYDGHSYGLFLHDSVVGSNDKCCPGTSRPPWVVSKSPRMYRCNSVLSEGHFAVIAPIHTIINGADMVIRCMEIAISKFPNSSRQAEKWYLCFNDVFSGLPPDGPSEVVLCNRLRNVTFNFQRCPFGGRTNVLRDKHRCGSRGNSFLLSQDFLWR